MVGWLKIGDGRPWCSTRLWALAQLLLNIVIDRHKEVRSIGKVCVQDNEQVTVSVLCCCADVMKHAMSQTGFLAQRQADQVLSVIVL